MRKPWLAAAAALTMLMGAAQAETSVPTAADAAALQRAQQQADLEIWHKAGMSFLPGPSQFPEVRFTPEYRKYEQLRNGPVFQETVARYLAGTQTAAEHHQVSTQR